MSEDQNLIPGLDEFGKVEQNEKKDGKYHIKITDGFRTTASNCRKLFDLILSEISEDNLVIERFITDKNMYHLILKPKP